MKSIGKNVRIAPSVILGHNCQIGNDSVIWHFSQLMDNCTLGNQCSIGQNVVVSEDVRLGNGVKVQNNVSIYTGVICEDFVFLGPSCVFTNVLNPRAAISRKAEYRQTLVQHDATIGANATILCGVTIGAYALIGAGAVVTKDVLPYALVVGNPARQIGWVSRRGLRLTFNESGEARCPESGELYRLENNQPVLIP